MDDDDPLLLAPSGRHGDARQFRTPGGSIVDIVDSGDFILQISDSGCGTTHSYRVSSTRLKRASAYFEKLLDPQKFNEGATVNARLTTLHEQYPNISQVPATDLPVIRVVDVGQFPKGACCESIIERFLNILHITASSSPNLRIPSTYDIALLAIVADRFSSLSPVSVYVKREGWHMPKQDAKEIKRNIPARDGETFWRQRILVGALLNVETWVAQYTSRLVVEGSRRWIQRDDSEGDEGEALWWNLPGGLEGEEFPQWEHLTELLTRRAEELEYRRACVVETINSLQNHFLTLYTSKQRQCKLGYDSSPQCDSFQLGEMVRFFTRKGTLRLQGLLTCQEEAQPWPGSICYILAALRQCPSYQIDQNHTHCGLRTRLLPILDQLEKLCSQAGVCHRCWKSDRKEHSWSENPSGGEWRFNIAHAFGRAGSTCRRDHLAAKGMFTAEERAWTPAP